MSLHPLPEGFDRSRAGLQRVAVHVLSRARWSVTGRIDLAPTVGGVGTPAFGPRQEVVRLAADALIVESTDGSLATTRSTSVNGSTLASLAAFAGADLTAPYSAGGDTPAIGDVDQTVEIEPGTIALVGQWFALGAAAIDAVVVSAHDGATPGRARIWPEHFDLGIDVAAPGGRRLNLGASPGDGFHEAPYLYVGPWDDDRPGDGDYWNVSFGAVLGYDDVRHGADPAGFFREGLDRFR